ncbi:hypothetical protein [Aporhodopirellula aestuarii]|uniref:Uncharacterized protein n=1 Tax=Aporhodopirellula aestuarii TaxID=2950107 RepID=A0ABT0UE34_9BACT|nr:hypothetical protein [Aporhodopirellula aestuarii]MCM2374994.1 hypothetical protein [Aporhodopirellula aestuarii]
MSNPRKRLGRMDQVEPGLASGAFACRRYRDLGWKQYWRGLALPRQRND